MWPLGWRNKAGEAARSGPLLTGDLGLCLLLPLNRWKLETSSLLVPATATEDARGKPEDRGSCKRGLLVFVYSVVGGFSFYFHVQVSNASKFIFCNVGPNFISFLISNK